VLVVPVGFIVNYLDITPVAIFVVNFVAIIPLAALLSYATEEIALRTGDVIGGLLNASFGYYSHLADHRPASADLFLGMPLS
jgi:Ca2+:H+ antiporter